MTRLLPVALLLFQFQGVAQNLEQRFERLMRDLLIFDAHIDTPRYTVDEGYRWATYVRPEEVEIDAETGIACLLTAAQCAISSGSGTNAP